MGLTLQCYGEDVNQLLIRAAPNAQRYIIAVENKACCVIVADYIQNDVESKNVLI